MIFTDNFHEIGNARYVVSRVFGNEITAEKLIEQRVLDSKSHNIPLTGIIGTVYNEGSTSNITEVL